LSHSANPVGQCFLEYIYAGVRICLYASDMWGNTPGSSHAKQRLRV
jgi:hypothetical protein